MFKLFFEGWYFKHQNAHQTVAIIPGISASGAFVQIITDTASYNVDFPKEQFSKTKQVRIGNCVFDTRGIKLDIKTPDLTIHGKVSYHELTPLNSDIMGPFRFFPLQCRHGIISMHHKLSGFIEINGEVFNFTKGIGYIEKDSGYSFPKSYAWVHSNYFAKKCSITAAIADIIFCGFHFQGVIAAIYHGEREYRMATYNGAKALTCTKQNIIIANNALRLEICLPKRKGLILHSPINGKMNGIVKETPACNACFKFFEGDSLVFDMISPKTSCEFVGEF